MVEKEKQLQRKAEEEKENMEEDLSWVRGSMGRLKEEMYKQRDQLKRMAETEIERLKEELLQQKERDDLLRAQTNRSLKDKHVDFEKLYQDHKELEKEFDRQHERLREV